MLRTALRSATTAALLLVSTGCDGKSPAPDAARQVALSAPVPIHLSVKGMHCEGCEGAICAKVGKIEGVGECVASHAAERVDLVAPPEQRAAIVQAIEKLGYTVAGDAAAPSTDEPEADAAEGAAEGAAAGDSAG
ncbi:MAG: Heavy-metal-associated domain [Planctomycetota bacterium]